MTAPRRTLAVSALAAGLAAIAVLALAASASAAAGLAAYRHDLRRIDTHFRTAIEYASPELGEGLNASEVVCGLAARSEQQGDAPGAAADWATLGHLVDEVDRPAATRVATALEEADGDLRALGQRFAGAPGGGSRAAGPASGVAAARQGARMLSAAIGRFDAALEAWPAHQCQAAADAVQAAVARIPAAVARINAGMRRLWELAYPHAAAPRAAAHPLWNPG